MARYIQRPENALKRANEFIDVGKPARALDTLQEVFRNKKWTYNWSESVIEPIMFKYLDLCVELRKSHIAKEGLFQYRNMFQLVNVGSLENVIRGYLRMAEERTEMAQQQSSQAVLDIDDLDNLETPESILMSAVCGEDAQDRSDRTILLPWVKFLWESYCQCLELLRVNTHCEVLYHDIARMTFQFCLKYNRKMEFRKLCEKLRKHLEDICKTTPQTANVSITKPETQQLNLDTRLHQLDSAIQMEAWQEAYKAIEDIHGLMTLSKKTPVAKTMANYYQKLAMVFWKAGNQLFHAAALLKLFQLTREMKKNITPEELQRMASHVLVATLAIPLPSAHPEFDRFIETDKSPLEKAQRLAVLLGLTQTPTRASLLKEIIRVNVVQLASEKFCNLYQWLEIDFDPLNLCGKVQSAIDFIEDDPNSLLKQYSQSLKDVTLVRLVRQICQVYQSIEFSRLLVLAKFADIFYLERILVDCVRHNDMQIRIDHKKQSIHFGTDLTESQREDHPDGPTLQSMPSEQVRSQLVNMSVVLHQAITTINPNHKKADREKLRNRMVQYYHDNKAKEHHQVLQRQKIIEERKEHIERLNNEREEEEMRRLEEINRLQKIAEQKRLEAELEERERKRHENEILQIKEKSLKEKMQQISQTAHGQKVLKKLDEEEIRKLDAEQIAAREAEELIKERKELQSKLKSQEKKIDYYERAKRIEEIPLIDAYLQEKQVLDKQFWETQEQQRIENSISERKNAVSQQERLKRMHVDRDTFLNNLKAERNSMYIEKLKAFNTYLEEEKKKRIAQRIIDRREERRAKWLREKEEERLRQEEELRRLKEEEERIERERLNKLHEIEMEKLRAQAEKQRIKNEEAERKIQAEREAILKQVEKERETWPKEKDEMSNWRTQKTGGGERERERDRDREQKSEPWRPKFREADNRGPGDRERGNEKWRHGGERDQEGRENRDNREVRDRKPMDRDRPIRRGGDEKREDRRVDTGRPIRRDDDRPERRGGERDFNRDRRDGPRRDDRDRRGGEDRERRGGDDRERRGGDDRREGFGRRQMDREQKSDGGNWRRGPARDGDGPRTGEGGNWRAERPARRTEEDKDQDGGEWTSVKRH